MCSDYNISETEDTSSDSRSEISTDMFSNSIKKGAKKRQKIPQEPKQTTNLKKLDIKEIILLRKIIRING